MAFFSSPFFLLQYVIYIEEVRKVGMKKNTCLSLSCLILAMDIFFLPIGVVDVFL